MTTSRKNPGSRPRWRDALRAGLLLVAALLATGCQRALFAYANAGRAPPDASDTFGAQRGLGLDTWRSRGAPGAGAPVVVFFHGGSWRSGKRQDYRFVGDALARAGMVVVVADYRKAPLPTFPGFMEDAAAAVRWARDHASSLGGDPARVYVMGHSAGGQIAALLATDARYLQAQGMAPKDLAGVIGLAGAYDFDVGEEYAPVFGPPAMWPRAQAIGFVDGDEPPFLLVHGRDDRVVHDRDSLDIDAKLRANGVQSTLLRIHGGHLAPLAGLRDVRRAPAVMPAIVAFTGAVPAEREERNRR